MPSSAATASTISSRSTYVKGFDSGRCRSGSDGSSFTLHGSGFVIPTKSSSQRAAAPRRYSRCPLWKGWNLPWIIPRRLFDDDAAPFLDVADPADEEPPRGELGLERRPLLGRKRDEQAAGRLRVVAERREHVGDAVEPDVRGREVAVPRIAARADALARHVERAVDGREALRLEPQAHAAPLRHLARVPEEAEVRLGVPDRVPAREEPARRAHLLVGGGEDAGEHLHRQILGEGRARECE